MRMRPDQPQHEQGEAADEDAGDRRGSRRAASRGSRRWRCGRRAARPIGGRLRGRRHSPARRRWNSAPRNSSRPCGTARASRTSQCAMRTARISSDQSPITREASLSVTMVSHSTKTIGARPSRRPGTTSSSAQATISLGRLISTSMLPASDSIERRLVLEASSSMSPRRGSMNRSALARLRRFASSSRACSPW